MIEKKVYLQNIDNSNEDIFQKLTIVQEERINIL